jgi:hypothetical protein
MPRGFPWPGRWASPPLVERVDDGYRVNLGRLEQRVLHQAFDDLRALLAEGDPSTRRLFPTAYVDHPRLEAEYRSMVGDDLQRSQLDALDTVERSIEGEVVDRDGLEAWMRSVNALRLVIGTQLDVDENPEPVPVDDPDYARYGVYDFLSQLLAWIVDALASEQDPPAG